MTVVIESQGLTKFYRGRMAVDHLDLSIQEGEIFGFLGPNGSGKTTTVRMLTTITRPDKGSAKIMGQDVLRDGPAIRRNLGVVTQRGGGYWFMSLEDNVRLYLLAQGLSWHELSRRTNEVLEAFDLVEHRHKKLLQLSGGLCRRMQVARVLGIPKPVFFVDEPTSGLDPVSRRQVWKALLQAKKAGSTIFLTTQSMEEAQTITDRVCILQKGRAMICETTETLRKRFGKTGVCLRLESAPTSSLETLGRAFETLSGIVSVYIDSDVIFLSLSENAEARLPAVLHLIYSQGASIKEMEVSPATLEDAYLHLITEGIS